MLFMNNSKMLYGLRLSLSPLQFIFIIIDKGQVFLYLLTCLTLFLRRLFSSLSQLPTTNFQRFSRFRTSTPNFLQVPKKQRVVTFEEPFFLHSYTFLEGTRPLSCYSIRLQSLQLSRFLIPLTQNRISVKVFIPFLCLVVL